MEDRSSCGINSKRYYHITPSNTVLAECKMADSSFLHFSAHLLCRSILLRLIIFQPMQEQWYQTIVQSLLNQLLSFIASTKKRKLWYWSVKKCCQTRRLWATLNVLKILLWNRSFLTKFSLSPRLMEDVTTLYLIFFIILIILITWNT